MVLTVQQPHLHCLTMQLKKAVLCQVMSADFRAFIPVSEDAGMIAAATDGVIYFEKLEAMTCVCSVGLDMIVIPAITTAETISAIIADEAAIGMVNTKTTAVRVIPAPGKVEGDVVEFGGLWEQVP